MTDVREVISIIHYGSKRCRRLKRSVMSSEIHSLVLGFDHAFCIRNLLQEILGRKMELRSYVDRQTVIYVISQYGQTNERRLQIDISTLRESYAMES